MIQLKNIVKSYHEADTRHTVLKDLDLEIAQGEIIVLLGKSGSGKSTLLNLISGIDLPDSGSIRLRGQEITGMSEKERTLFRRKHIGFVFQFFNLMPTLTVAENLQLGLELNGLPVNGKISTILEQTGLLHKMNSYPDTLSGGEQQRIAIARALIHEPEYILADEPTGNLDYETSGKIVDLLDLLVRQTGKTMIMATHSPEVIGLADRVITVKEGKITELDKEKLIVKAP